MRNKSERKFNNYNVLIYKRESTFEEYMHYSANSRMNSTVQKDAKSHNTD